MKYFDNFSQAMFLSGVFLKKKSDLMNNVVCLVNSQACCENRATIGHNYVDVLILEYVAG